MVDNSSSFKNVGVSGINFKDAQSNAGKLSDEKMGSEAQYFALEQEEDETEENLENDTPYVDRSAQLNASLNSLAMMNVINVLKKGKDKEKFLREFDIRKEEVKSVESDEE
ncbi:MAG: hypothetical protein MRZ90_04455 [Candidatus Gastranaerophilales bacterium]|nr:hypothetical protein [Candidatus Gastranaerophilales bacterium]